MTSQKDTYRLANGVEIPCLGFGTWQTPDGDPLSLQSIYPAFALSLLDTG